ncbi:hypothetical protein HWI79_3114 [Cryptosporidium felis]|nr:hypothetical protein HWI79_3114 [Cryptosporidium felis]
MTGDQEWSDSSFALRRRHRLNWSAIIREVPRLEGSSDEEGRPFAEKLEKMFSRWSVSLGFSLPSSVEVLEELCIQKGKSIAVRVGFPSRSSTRSFVRQSRRNIWKEISRESYCELFVDCSPPYSIRPFLDGITMDMATRYWLIRDVSGEIENEEVFWELIGRRNPFGEFLKRVVYFRDEGGKKGFCFLQFSSPLNSYRALKWEAKERNRAGPKQKRGFSEPNFIGTGQVQTMLLLYRYLDRFETKTLARLESQVSSGKETNPIGALESYFNFWKRSGGGVSIPVDSRLEFQYFRGEAYGSDFEKALERSGLKKDPSALKLYYNRRLDLVWDWNTRLFYDVQSSSLLEFDSGSRTLELISSSKRPSRHEKPGEQPGFKQESASETKSLSHPEAGIKCDIETRNEEIIQVSREKLNKEREIRVASFLETARSQLSYHSSNPAQIDPGPDLSEKKRRISEIFDVSCAPSTESRPKPKVLRESFPGPTTQSEESPPRPITGNSEGRGWSVSDSGEGRREDREELICFVCCRVFATVRERVSHEQSSLLHLENVESSRGELEEDPVLQGEFPCD